MIEEIDEISKIEFGHKIHHTDADVHCRAFCFTIQIEKNKVRVLIHKFLI